MEKKAVAIANLSVNLDLPQCDLPDNVFTRAINFVTVNSKLTATKESVPAPKLSKKGPWYSVPSSDLFLNIVSGQRNNQHYFLVSGLQSDYIFDGSSWLDITSTDKDSSSISSQHRNLWTSCKLGFNILVNNSEFFPEYW